MISKAVNTLAVEQKLRKVRNPQEMLNKAVNTLAVVPKT